MIDPPQIVQIAARPTAIIHLTVPREEMPEVFGPAIGELMAALAAQGIAPAGPVFAHHLKITPETFDFEVSVPVATPIAAAGRVQPSEWPAMRAARTVYHGPYEGLYGAWEAFMEWIATNGHQPAQDVWECYLAGPESSPDPANWRTELNRPLLD